jgi:D-tyrosyl-tRNA(Tyr) deacylase
VRALIQRVRHASVEVEGKVVGSIGPGLLAFVAVQQGDEDARADAMVARLLAYRVFPDERGRMNLDVRQAGGGVLAVSQFTLAADTSRGLRPSFTSAAPAEEGRRLYDAFVAQAKALHPQVQTGIFGADMKVHLVNDGPVTIPITIIGA